MTREESGQCTDRQTDRDTDTDTHTHTHTHTHRERETCYRARIISAHTYTLAPSAATAHV